MIGKLKQCDYYIGPRAIFDPNFIPPQLLYRSKEEHTLFSILNDSFSDEFCLNILYQGIQGIGKKVIINKVIKDLLDQNKKNLNLHKISLDCKEKNFKEIIISLLTEITHSNNLNLDYQYAINSGISDLWNLFKLTCKKVNFNLVLIFNNIEYFKPEYFKKFLQYGKEAKINLISTVNKVLRPSTLNFLNHFDIKKKLNYFTYNELFKILKQRVSLTFLHKVDNELIEFITDLIFEHFVPVPGKGIDVLRELYSLLSDQSNYKNIEFLEIIQSQFDSIQLSDEFSILTYISEEDLLTILFLDNLSNYFLKKSRFYITFQELKETYYISCEAIDYEKIEEDFDNIIKLLQSIGILNISKKFTGNINTFISDNKNADHYYFLTINPKRLKAIIDAVFNNI